MTYLNPRRHRTACRIRSTIATLAALAAPLLRGAISDVVIWDGVRTEEQLRETLANGYASIAGMRQWWNFSDPNHLGRDATGNGRHGVVKGVVSALPMRDPFGVTRPVATGFNHDTCYIVNNPGFTNGSTADRTYELWIRNPGKDSSVFFSITQTETGGGDDLKRMWVNADGSITIADYGSLTPRTQAFTSAPLTWNKDEWYQIALIFDYTANSRHTVRVYRGERPGTLTQLFNYTGSNLGSQHWLAVGGHERGFYSNGVGKAGFLGCDGTGEAPVITPETFGAKGDGLEDDTDAWRKATSLLSAYGKGTLRLRSGAIYKVGRETIDPSPTTPYYKAAPLGHLLGATLGKITVEGNNATVKLAPGLHFGSFDPVTGATTSGRNRNAVNAATPGDLLKVQACREVEVKDIHMDGSIADQVWGGLWTADSGIQLPQSGLHFVDNDSVHVHDVRSHNNSLDGIDVTNNVTPESPIKKVLIERAHCYYNGRQGLSYNCGNNLEVYHSVFAFTGRIQANSPACGADVEPIGRYMAPGTLFDSCVFYDNRSYGLMLTGAPACIVRNCVMWGTTTYGLTIYLGDDHDHLIVNSTIYGGVYHRNALRTRFESCNILNPPTAFYSAAEPNARTANRIGIEQVGGSLTVSGSTIQALQTNYSAWLSNAVLQNTTVTHGNYNGTATRFVGALNGSFLWNTRFTETPIFAANPTSTNYVHDYGGTAQVGPGCVIEGPTLGSEHYVSWSTSDGARPIRAHALPVDTLDGVLTPNAEPGEFVIETGATYSVSHPFTSPADDTGSRLFDGDAPELALGSNRRAHTVTVDLKSAYDVRSVRMRMNQPAKPPRVNVSVGDGSAWTFIGLVRPTEGAALAPWFDVTIARPVSGRFVKLDFQSDDDATWFLSELKIYGAAPLTAPTITSFSPSTVDVGQSLTIAGSGFTPGTTVTIGGAAIDPALITYRSATRLVISSVPLSATSGAIVVTTAGGAATSASEVVVVPPPLITQHPVSQTATVGDTVTFTVAATSNVSLEYRWRRNGSVIATQSGPEGATLVLANITVAHAGTYDCQVVNRAGMAVSNPATLTVNKAVASVTLSRLVQPYDGTPRMVVAATTPAGLPFTLTYNGATTAPRLPGRYTVEAAVVDANYTGAATAVLDVSATVLVQHAPSLNGGVAGSVQVALAESATLNGGAYVSGDLLMPGRPSLRVNGNPTYVGITDETGASTPDHHTVTLNGNAVLRYLVRRVDAAALPVVAPPATPGGTRDVTLNAPGESLGDAATLRNLTLNGNAGRVVLPPGAYGRLVANGNTMLVLGLTGGAAPAIYDLQSLALNGNARLELAGPVVMTLANGLTLQGEVGDLARPEWLTIRVADGALTLNGNSTLAAYVLAPNGTVSINGGKLKGRVTAERLVINGRGMVEDGRPE